MNRTAPIPLHKKIAYASPAFSLAIIGIPVYVHLPKFYADVVGMSAATLGVLLFAVRLFDAVTDPLIGLLSDRTRTRFGRRRPYILFGSPLVVLCLWVVFNPPALPQSLVPLWFGAGMFALFLFWTVVTVPYESLGAEITFDYHERTALLGMRDAFLVAGTLAAAASPVIVTLLYGLPEGSEGERAVFFRLSVVYAPMVIATCAWCFAAIREQPALSEERAAAPVPPVTARGIRRLLENRPFLVLLAAYAVSAFGANMPATLILFYVAYVLESPDANLFLMLYFITGVLFMPMWIILSRRTEKKTAWLCAMLVNTGAFVGVFFLGRGDAAIYGVLVFLSGIGLGGTLALPSSIQADVIDYDELLTGERREGLYIGVWSVAKKMVAAAGVGMALMLLGAAGYTPGGEQTEAVRRMLRVLYALVPSLCNIAAFFIAVRYPIDSDAHQRILDLTERRKRGEPVWEPLYGRRIG